MFCFAASIFDSIEKEHKYDEYWIVTFCFLLFNNGNKYKKN